MKKITTFLLTAILALSVTAQQQHYCSKQKASHFNKKYSTSLPVGYTPPESNYDLTFVTVQLLFLFFYNENQQLNYSS